MGWWLDVPRHVLERSRPSFHPAAIAIWWSLTFFVVLGVAMTALSWVFSEPGEYRTSFDYAVFGSICGLCVAGEAARGFARGLLGKQPEQWSFVALGIGGAVAGLVFAGYIALMWGNTAVLEYVVMAGLGAAFWVGIGACIYWERKKQQRKAAGLSGG